MATRYVWPDNESPATLYYAEGTSFERLLEPHEQMLTGKGAWAWLLSFISIMTDA